MKYVKDDEKEYVDTEKVGLDGEHIRVINADGYGSCDITIGYITMRWSDLDELKRAIAEAERRWRTK